MAHTETLLEGLAFPEAPRWREGRLWFSDQHARRVMTVTTDGTVESVVEIDDLPGGLGWLPDGTPLVVAMTRRSVYRIEGSGVRLHADLSGLASFHCNDMVVDLAGNAYVGNFGYDLHGGAPISPAELIRVSVDGGAEVVARDLVFPNGSVITPDGGRLIVAETFASRLTAFELDPEGNLSGRAIWADLGEATPDGICLDADGAIWAASPVTGEVVRVRKGGGRLDLISPTGTPYACMLGGPERRTLFITTSETADPDQAADLRSGRVELVEVEVPGTGLP